jgi:hypothetical protein
MIQELLRVTCFALLVISLTTRCIAESADDQFSLSPIYATQEAPPTTGSDDSETLAKKLSNPIANLISVPFQFNDDKGIGSKDADKLTLNIQPVIPFSLNENWNLITRTIVPVIYQASIADGVDSRFGLGDVTQSFFFSPKAPTAGGWIWGVGPVLLWPSATNDILGSGKWGAGPTAVLLKQNSGWTYGVLANHIWSYAGVGDRNAVNATFIQPFVTYTFHTATTVALNTESTYDWTSSQWTVPLNLTLGQIVRIGKLPVQFTFGGRYYAQRPSGGPDWGLRFVTTFLLPK